MFLNRTPGSINLNWTPSKNLDLRIEPRGSIQADTVIISCSFFHFQPNNFVVGRKCRALYDCEADNEDELTFEEGDIILVINEDTEDENWMEGCLMTDPGKRGLFPVSFVHMLDEHSWC